MFVSYIGKAIDYFGTRLQESVYVYLKDLKKISYNKFNLKIN